MNSTLESFKKAQYNVTKTKRYFKMVNGDSQSEEKVMPRPQPEQPAFEAESQVSEAQEMSDDEDDEGLPFPNARIIRLIREEIKSGKQIRGEVKTALNIWLGDLLKNVAKEMDRTQYGSICIADFQRATKPHDMVKDIVKDRERLMISIEKLKQDADQIKRDMSRFFVALTGKLEEQQQE